MRVAALALAAAACRAPPAPVAVAWEVTVHDARELDAALAAARAAHRPAWLDVTASWCAACRLLERTTLTDPAVATAARRFVTIRVGASAGEAALAVTALPTQAFVSSGGERLAAPRLAGTVLPDELLAALAEVH